MSSIINSVTVAGDALSRLRMPRQEGGIEFEKTYDLKDGTYYKVSRLDGGRYQVTFLLSKDGLGEVGSVFPVLVGASTPEELSRAVTRVTRDWVSLGSAVRRNQVTFPRPDDYDPKLDPSAVRNGKIELAEQKGSLELSARGLVVALGAKEERLRDRDLPAGGYDEKGYLALLAAMANIRIAGYSKYGELPFQNSASRFSAMPLPKIDTLQIPGVATSGRELRAAPMRAHRGQLEALSQIVEATPKWNAVAIPLPRLPQGTLPDEESRVFRLSETVGDRTTTVALSVNRYQVGGGPTKEHFYEAVVMATQSQGQSQQASLHLPASMKGADIAIQAWADAYLRYFGPHAPRFLREAKFFGDGAVQIAPSDVTKMSDGAFSMEISDARHSKDRTRLIVRYEGGPSPYAVYLRRGDASARIGTFSTSDSSDTAMRRIVAGQVSLIHAFLTNATSR